MAKKESKPLHLGKIISSINEVSYELRKWMQRFEESEGEITEELEEEIQGYVQNKEKLGEILCELNEIIEHYEFESNKNKAMAELLLKKSKTFSNKSDYVRDLALSLVKRYGDSKLTDANVLTYAYETNVYKFKAVPSQSVKINDEESIPDNYKNFTITIDNISKEAADKLMAALKSEKSPVNSDSVTTNEKIMLQELKKAIKSDTINENVAELVVNYSFRK